MYAAITELPVLSFGRQLLSLKEGTINEVACKADIRRKPPIVIFNYIYVRVGACTYLHKRTEDDIWKNLFEFPLIETEAPVTEEEFRELPQVRAFFADGEVSGLRLISGNVKHVLSHRVIIPISMTLFTGKFYFFFCLSAGEIEDLEQYAVSRLVHAFLEKYL